MLDRQQLSMPKMRLRPGDVTRKTFSSNSVDASIRLLFSLCPLLILRSNHYWVPVWPSISKDLFFDGDSDAYFRQQRRISLQTLWTKLIIGGSCIWSDLRLSQWRWWGLMPSGMRYHDAKWVLPRERLEPITQLHGVTFQKNWIFILRLLNDDFFQLYALHSVRWVDWVVW
jgi:hypothetical protein